MNAHRKENPNALLSVGCCQPFSRVKICDESGKEGSDIFKSVALFVLKSAQVPIGEVGEICGLSGLEFDGYYKNDAETRKYYDAEKWMKTGDLGYLDKSGFLFLAGRKKDMIISGGANVYPIDIERVLQEHPMVLEAAVFGVPDEKWGEKPVAAVVLVPKAETSASIAGEIREWTNKSVNSKLERISDLVIVASLPRNVAGKVLKVKLF